MKELLVKLLAELKKLGLPADKESEATKMIEESLKGVSTTPTTTPTQDPQIAQLVQIVTALKDENASLMKAFNDEKQARDESAKRLQDQAKKQREKEIETKLDKAIEEGRITPTDRDKWKGRLEKDFETNSETLQELQANPALAKQQNKGADGKGANNSKDGKSGSETPSGDYLANRGNYLDAAKAEFASSMN